jgi:hypothetical protein
LNDVILAQAKDLMVTALKELAPEMDLSEGTPQYDLFINPLQSLVAAIVEQNNAVEARRNAAQDQWASLTTAEADAEAALKFTERFKGGKSVGSVRIKFKKAVDLRLNPGNIVKAGDRVYHPFEAVAIAGTSLARDPILGYYYADFVIQADQNGSAYDMPAGEAVVIDSYANDDNVLESLTSGPVQGGFDDETNVEMYQRVQRNQTTRNLVSALAIEAVLKERYSTIIRRLQVVGYQEPEMLRDRVSFVDTTLNVPLTLNLGGNTDVYVQTPIVRQTVEVFLPAGESEIDLAPYRAVLKIHGVRDKDEPTATPFYAMINWDPKLRYSALDPLKLYVDPGLGGRTLQLDMSYAPDVVTINDFCQSAPVRLTCANLLVRYFHPVWLSANIYAQGAVGLEVEIAQAINGYLATVTGDDPVVVSKLTEAIHSVGTAMVFQDFELTAEVQLSGGPPTTTNTATTLNVAANYDRGFSARVALYINEGIRVTAIV